MSLFSRRSLICSAFFVGLLPTLTLAADKPKEIRIDWATYNPVSMVLKEQGLLEKEFAKDGIAIRWVQTLGSNKALEFLNAGSIDFGSTAGSAALLAKINGNPIKSIYVYSRPEWTALVTRKDSNITKVSDLKGKRVAVTRGTGPTTQDTGDPGPSGTVRPDPKHGIAGVPRREIVQNPARRTPTDQHMQNGVDDQPH